MLTRTPDWQTRLDRFLTAHYEDKFKWGVWDCCLFACTAIEVMTGTDPAAAFRGRYSTRSAAFRLAGSVQAVARKVTAENGMEPVGVLLAGRGDLVLVTSELPRRKSKTRPPDKQVDHALGIISLNGKDVLVLVKDGLVKTSISLAIEAWRV